MKLNDDLVAEPVVTNVNLVNGKFTKSETSDIINALIDVKIKFHKVQRLQQWESDHNNPGREVSSRLQELEEIKASTKEWLAVQIANGRNFSIVGDLKIIVED
tara:strand:- start:1271 stop:1579 length:309 start_codon:yes stop_codon:yes gene_type:complete